jgi:xanthine dehydrogenase accessory factor
VVLVTVAATGGSPPGKAGAKMLVTAAGHEGTVGGGKVEAAALEHARRLLGADTGPEILKLDVVQDLEMSCGGTMTLVLEPVTPPLRLVIFGAGHISEALCHLAAWAGFDVTVCDEREDWLTPERFPDARTRIVAPWEDAVQQARLDARTFVTSITPGHAFDQRVVRTVMAGNPPRYLGVIGSKRKAALFRKELIEEAGVAPERAEALHIPMGLAIGAADPREIALSIAAELVLVARGVAS